MRTPPAGLCCNRPIETVEQKLLYAYQGLKDPARGADPVEDHLPAFIHQEASNVHSDEDLKDKFKPFDPRVQKLVRTYLEVSVLEGADTKNGNRKNYFFSDIGNPYEADMTDKRFFTRFAGFFQILFGKIKYSFP